MVDWLQNGSDLGLSQKQLRCGLRLCMWVLVQIKVIFFLPMVFFVAGCSYLLKFLVNIVVCCDGVLGEWKMIFFFFFFGVPLVALKISHQMENYN